MGIQINGNTDIISAIDGSLDINGLNSVNATGISTFSNIRITGGTISGVSTAGITTVHATSIVGVTTAGITTVYTNSFNDGPLAGFRNFIINGNMAISQGGTSFSTINTYNLDRYRTFGGPITHTITQQDSIATYAPSRYALRAARNSGATETNELGIAQGIESQNSYALRGKTVTISFRARCGANFSSASNTLLVRVWSGTGTDENPLSMTGMNTDISQSVTLTTSLQTFSVTGTLSASLTQATLAFSYAATGTAGANDWFEITDVQLEIGNRATPFERRSYGQELLLCQRYFETNYPVGYAPGSNSGLNGCWFSVSLNGNDFYCYGRLPFIVAKRTDATLTLYNPITGGGNWYDINISGANGNTAVRYVGQYGASIYASTTFAANHAYAIRYTASSEL